ncbi:PTS sugar transporter subunit IIA [Schnuerera sp. xch1]|uniref:PTS sugar transporter subunit IIA n=1 Tax=Schnuerera sp. xch1 TaxID=2874283 RepID=UPI001CBB5993|nr:PTS sugar transporter subunit IIA [Schnuerera sp. xch1]MBZ2175098.1 PTS sugar transporter subunit IIA [Schnuerera sp. xch1]
MKTFKKEYVLLNVDISTREEAIAFIATKASELDISNDRDKTELDLWDREREYNTAIGDMIAIPHTKSPSINFPVVLIIKPKDIIDWYGENVNLIISFLSPKKNTNNIHLTMLSKISRKLVNEEFKTTLSESNDIDLIYEMIMGALNS